MLHSETWPRTGTTNMGQYVELNIAEGVVTVVSQFAELDKAQDHCGMMNRFHSTVSSKFIVVPVAELYTIEVKS